MRATECGKEAWSINREPMTKSRIEGAVEQGERAWNREARDQGEAVSMRRLSDEGVRSYLGRSRLAPERATEMIRSEKSAEAVVAAGSERRVERVGGPKTVVLERARHQKSATAQRDESRRGEARPEASRDEGRACRRHSYSRASLRCFTSDTGRRFLWSQVASLTAAAMLTALVWAWFGDLWPYVLLPYGGLAPVVGFTCSRKVANLNGWWGLICRYGVGKLSKSSNASVWIAAGHVFTGYALNHVACGGAADLALLGVVKLHRSRAKHFIEKTLCRARDPFRGR
jgi:hypothetical protein